MRTFLRIIRALGDQNRVRIIASLAQGELCVCQIVELLKLAHSTVSKHLSILAQADLVVCRKEGRWIYYRLTTTDRSLATKMTALIIKELQQDDAIQQDRILLKRILRMDAEQLCLLQKKKRDG